MPNGKGYQSLRRVYCLQENQTEPKVFERFLRNSRGTLLRSTPAATSWGRPYAGLRSIHFPLLYSSTPQPTLCSSARARRVASRRFFIASALAAWGQMWEQSVSSSTLPGLPGSIQSHRRWCISLAGSLFRRRTSFRSMREWGRCPSTASAICGFRHTKSLLSSASNA